MPSSRPSTPRIRPRASALEDLAGTSRQELAAFACDALLAKEGTWLCNARPMALSGTSCAERQALCTVLLAKEEERLTSVRNSVNANRQCTSWQAAASQCVPQCFHEATGDAFQKKSFERNADLWHKGALAMSIAQRRLWILVRTWAAWVGLMKDDECCRHLDAQEATAETSDVVANCVDRRQQEVVFMRTPVASANPLAMACSAAVAKPQPADEAVPRRSDLARDTETLLSSLPPPQKPPRLDPCMGMPGLALANLTTETRGTGTAAETRCDLSCGETGGQAAWSRHGHPDLTAPQSLSRPNRAIGSRCIATPSLTLCPVSNLSPRHPASPSINSCTPLLSTLQAHLLAPSSQTHLAAARRAVPREAPAICEDARAWQDHAPNVTSGLGELHVPSNMSVSEAARCALGLCPRRQS